MVRDPENDSIGVQERLHSCIGYAEIYEAGMTV
jgi:hypothetical protein